MTKARLGRLISLHGEQRYMGSWMNREHLCLLTELRAEFETWDPDAEVRRLRAAIEAVLADAESQHPGGWGPDVTMVAVLKEALSS